jgi:hypothetical protein
MFVNGATRTNTSWVTLEALAAVPTLDHGCGQVRGASGQPRAARNAATASATRCAKRKGTSTETVGEDPSG